MVSGPMIDRRARLQVALPSPHLWQSLQPGPQGDPSVPVTFPTPSWVGWEAGCPHSYPARVLPMGRTGPGHASTTSPAWQPPGRSCSPLSWGGGWRSSPASTPNPLLARPPEPVGLCLYLVTLGGFASSTGIWHPRWKISLVRSPWKQAEPPRRFTLNGAHPACIRCPMCLEFPPRLLEPLGRPGTLLSRRASGLGPWD